MTVPNGPILFNSTGGSDTLSSGLGPIPAVNGAGASTTAASVTVTGIDTTGVSVGDLLWVLSSSGRQFSIIATIIDGTSVTCDDTFANTEASRTWAIGGKRATLNNADSRTLFAFLKEGWIIETETDQTVTSTTIVVNPTVCSWTLRGDSSTERTINQTANAPVLNQTTDCHANLRYIKLTNSNGTKSSATGFLGRGSCVAIRCTFGDPTNTLFNGISRISGAPLRFVIEECLFQNTVNAGISSSTGDPISCRRSRFFTIGSSAITCGRAQVVVIQNNIFHGIVNNVISFGDGNGGNTSRYIKGNLFYDCDADAIAMSHASQTAVFCIENNVFYSIGGVGIRGYGAMIAGLCPTNNNAILSITGGFLSSWPTTDPGLITLTADPFEDAANGNFNLNNAAGGGAVLRGISVNMP